MKRFLFLVLLLSTLPALAGSRDLIKAAPSDSYFVLAADVASLHDNEVFISMEKKDRLWSFDEGSETGKTLKMMNVDPKKDIRSFLFARYVNQYGSKGKVHVFELTRDISSGMGNAESKPYLGVQMHRLQPDSDLYAAPLMKEVWAVGALTGVKTAIDVSRGKQKPLTSSEELNGLYGRVPKDAAFWGMAVPFSRRQAATLGTKQSTNAMLEAFDNYYYYGLPTTRNIDAHFIGRAKSDGEAAFVSTFMIGTLTFAKFKVNDEVAEMLDSVDIRRNEREIHVSGTVTKEIMDSYYNGELGVK